MLNSLYKTLKNNHQYLYNLGIYSLDSVTVGCFMTEVDTLKKEVARLSRRNKLLTKRVKKLQEENTNLVIEIEALDTSNSHVHTNELDSNVCPECSSELVSYAQSNSGVTLYMCTNINCKFRRKI